MNKQAKSAKLGLSFPYDWSNPDISDDALILNVLARGIFEDVCRICMHFGVDAAERLYLEMPPTGVADPAIPRMLSNIRKGFARVQST